MKPSDEPRRVDKNEPPKLSRSGEALRIIEEYADQLREIIKKLRRVCIEAMTGRRCGSG
jgi:hypothetical protein